jgi:arabinogalactan oligomer/maltooligosaccharide transport system permease protein
MERKDYNWASTIGIIIFVISATISILTLRNLKSYKNEEEFS